MVRRPEALVSVIIPCYNAGRWLREAIESSLAQTHHPIEVIVVDDGSTDDSVDIMRGFGTRIRFVQQRHANGNRARNVGISLSRGAYLQFLDADDCLLPEKVATQVVVLQTTDADAVYCDYAVLAHNDGMPRLGPFRATDAGPDLLTALLRGHWIPLHALLWRREAIEALGGWDETFSAAQDYDLMLRAAMQGLSVCYQTAPSVVVRRYGKVTVSTSDPLRLLRNRIRALQKVERWLTRHEAMRRRYAPELARAYLRTARQLYSLDRRTAAQLGAHSFFVDPVTSFNFLRSKMARALVQIWLTLKRAPGERPHTR